MAFFGLPDNELPRGGPDEDLEVYTWGEDSYDGLGDALQEGDDDLNDETFGSVGAIGQGCFSPFLVPFLTIIRQGFRLFKYRSFRESPIPKST
jgi:Topoisomerase II-associated protein PAT1